MAARDDGQPEALGAGAHVSASTPVYPPQLPSAHVRRTLHALASSLPPYSQGPTFEEQAAPWAGADSGQTGLQDPGVLGLSGAAASVGAAEDAPVWPPQATAVPRENKVIVLTRCRRFMTQR